MWKGIYFNTYWSSFIPKLNVFLNIHFEAYGLVHIHQWNWHNTGRRPLKCIVHMQKRGMLWTYYSSQMYWNTADICKDGKIHGKYLFCILGWEYQEYSLAHLASLLRIQHIQREYSHKAKNAKIFMYLYFFSHLQAYSGIL